MLPQLQKFRHSAIGLIKKAKTAFTWRVFRSYLLLALPLAFLFAILFDIGLYVVDPMRLPLFIIRLGTTAWDILAVLVSVVLLLIASKQFLNWLGRLRSFVQASLPTHQLRLAIGIASLVTALLYPYCQAVTSYSSPPQSAIPNTPYSGTVVISDPLTSNNLWWKAASSQKNFCTFTDAGYEVRADKISKLQTCLAEKTNFSDFALQVEVTLKTGDVAGIWFRDRYMLMLLGNPFTNGYLDLYAFTQDGYRTELFPTCNPLQTGCPIGESFAPQQTITVTIVARGTSIELYVGTFKVKTLTNGISLSGRIGVFAGVVDKQEAAQTDALFANMKIWTNIA